MRTGVTEALRQFIELIRSPSGARGPGREVYVALGRGELREGRTLDALQSAYRVGARVAWRRWRPPRRGAGVDPTCSACSPSRSSPTSRAVGRLGRGLRRGSGAPRGRAPPAARASWSPCSLREPARRRGRAARRRRGRGLALPRSAAALACRAGPVDRLARAAPADALAATSTAWAALSCPTPTARAAAPRSSGLGARARAPRRARARPPGRLARASWSLARAALRASRPARSRPRPARRRRAHRTAALRRRARSSSGSPRAGWPRSTGLTPKARRRMEETALAFVQQHGNAAAMARALDCTPRPPLPPGAAARAARRPARRSRRALRARAGATSAASGRGRSERSVGPRSSARRRAGRAGADGT